IHVAEPAAPVSITMRVARNSQNPQQYTGVLDSTVGIQELCADRTYLRSLRVLHHRRNPFPSHYFGIVVQKKQIISSSLTGGQVVQPREIERFLISYNSVARSGEVVEHLVAATPIIDDYYFQILIIRLRFDAVYASI